jgi:hypothetical protein
MKVDIFSQFAAMLAGRCCTGGGYGMNPFQITPAGHLWLAYSALLITAAVMWMG